MLDIKFILENEQKVKQNVKDRNMKCNIDLLIKAYNEQKESKNICDNLRALSNQNTKEIAKAKTEAEKQKLFNNGKELREQFKAEEEKFNKSYDKYMELMQEVPNMMADDTPLGIDDKSNIEVDKFLEPSKFNFKPKNHIELGNLLDLIDFESGTKVTGSKFYFLKNELVLLDLALQNFAINKLVSKGYTPVSTPDLAKTSILKGSGFNPRGEESNIYPVEDTDLNLIATAEITIGGMHSNEIFKGEDLPKRYVGLSHCFRREAGAAGQADKGLYRVHQFTKVEMYQFARNEQGESSLQELLGIEKEIYKDLKIPFRVIRICSGDLGAPAYKKYDIEAWMPGKGTNGEYGEVTSVGNFTNFQSRRLNIKYTLGDSKEKHYVNTLNGTAIATGRVLLAIMENFQQADGSIKIPEVLWQYLPFKEICPKK